MKYRGGEHYSIHSRTFVRCLDLILHSIEKYLIPQESTNHNHSTTENNIKISPILPLPPSSSPLENKIEKSRNDNQVDDKIIFSRGDMNTLNSFNQTSEIFKNIWNSERMCSGGIGRGSLSSNKKYKPNRGNIPIDKSDKVIIPRSVGEISFRRKSQDLKSKQSKTKSGNLSRSLSPADRQSDHNNNINHNIATPDSSHKNVLVSFADNISAEKFESILNKIIEIDENN